MNHVTKPRPMPPRPLIRKCDPCEAGEHQACEGVDCGCWQAHAIHWPSRNRKGKPE